MAPMESVWNFKMSAKFFSVNFYFAVKNPLFDCEQAIHLQYFRTGYNKPLEIWCFVIGFV